ncbi:MAG: hypothetical protein F6K53_33030 [Moorea sp. SIO4A1]|uniref:hypothetical protein n=1 Tax=Moorena sp. SIO4A1 TaxID=2607835 RepID=UPI00144BE1A5|nr:hypothetical protein [Moorena sp. SIO4A1]NEQ61979.1 hypothetical protein [Moorena sp. SIO4A1]
MLKAIVKRVLRESASKKTLLHKCDQPYQLTEPNFNQISSNPCRNCDNFCSLLPTPYSLLPAPCSLFPLLSITALGVRSRSGGRRPRYANGFAESLNFNSS